MKVYIGFDDTDTLNAPLGTGKLVRWFQSALPESCRCQGVVRQQLLVCGQIPYTSHNSSACLIADVPETDLLPVIIERAAAHIAGHAAAGSDPGLCVVTERDPGLAGLVEFGLACARSVTTQRQALRAAGNCHLSGHGGTCDGIIGAAAAVGLTASGWSGRYIELGDLRAYGEATTVAALARAQIDVMSLDRDAKIPLPGDTVITNRWLRPRLMGHRPVLLVNAKGQGTWQNIYFKRNGKPSAGQNYAT
jgi:tRNA(Ile2) C34 agmatinyltransferase TiaS